MGDPTARPFAASLVWFFVPSRGLGSDPNTISFFFAMLHASSLHREKQLHYDLALKTVGQAQSRGSPYLQHGVANKVANICYKIK